jgi:hypothetical protein
MPQSASRKIMTASSTVLNVEHVRGLGVMTSAAVRAGGFSGGMGKAPGRSTSDRLAERR